MRKFIDRHGLSITLIGAIIGCSCPLGMLLEPISALVAMLGVLGILSLGLALVFIPILVTSKKANNEPANN